MSLDHLAVAVQGVGFRHESCAVQGFYTLEEFIQSVIAYAATLPLILTGYNVSIEFAQSIAVLASTLSLVLTPYDVRRRMRGVDVDLRFLRNIVELRLRDS